MEEIINLINENKNNDNSKICMDLIDFIKMYNLNSLEKLKQDEENRFIILNPNGNTKMTDQEILNKMYNEINNAYEDYINCSKNDQAKIDLLIKEYETIDDIEQKYINLINIYSILDWDLVLPYHIYIYITQNKI